MGGDVPGSGRGSLGSMILGAVVLLESGWGSLGSMIRGGIPGSGQGSFGSMIHGGGGVVPGSPFVAGVLGRRDRTGVREGLGARARGAGVGGACRRGWGCARGGSPGHAQEALGARAGSAGRTRAGHESGARAREAGVGARAGGAGGTRGGRESGARGGGARGRARGGSRARAGGGARARRGAGRRGRVSAVRPGAPSPAGGAEAAAEGQPCRLCPRRGRPCGCTRWARR